MGIVLISTDFLLLFLVIQRHVIKDIMLHKIIKQYLKPNILIIKNQ